MIKFYKIGRNLFINFSLTNVVKIHGREEAVTVLLKFIGNIKYYANQYFVTEPGFTLNF